MTTLSCQRVGEMSREGLLAPRSLPQQDGALKIKAASILNLAGILTTCPMPPRIQQWGESARVCDGILLLVTCRRRGGGRGGVHGAWQMARQRRSRGQGSRTWVSRRPGRAVGHAVGCDSAKLNPKCRFYTVSIHMETDSGVPELDARG